MKRFVLVFGALLGLSSTASPSEWTGFYLGANAGYGWGKDNSQGGSIGGVFNSGSSRSLNGTLYGAHGGYNVQTRDRIVLGLEADAAGSALQGESTTPLAFHLESGIEWVATLRVRLGYAVSPGTVLYATGGAAWAGIKSQRTDLSPGGPAPAGTVEVERYTAHGWTAGGGIERVLVGRWTARLEYRLYGFDTTEFSRAISQVRARHTFRADTVQAGVSYRF